MPTDATAPDHLEVVVGNTNAFNPEGDYYFNVLASISGTDTMCAEGVIRFLNLNQA